MSVDGDDLATFRSAAFSIARGLADSAVSRDAGCGWDADVAVAIDGEEPVIGRGDVGAGLYDGTAGIALALAACATAAEGEDAATFSETARGAAEHALAAAPDLLAAGRLGLFDGASGIAYSAVATAHLCGDRALFDAGRALAQEVAALVLAEESEELDLISGLAGSMLALQGALPNGGEEVVTAGARRLAAAVEPQTWGAAWPGVEGDHPLLGLAHGAAGITLTLGEAASVVEDGRVARACAEGLEYERGWFEPELAAWPDLRRQESDREESVAWTCAWCHGAIGIGLARLRLARLLADPVLLVEASAALQAARMLVIAAGTRLREGEIADCSACHGLAAVAELFLVAASALGVPDHARAARRVAALMLEQRRAGDAWSCGLPNAGEIPALMTGTAGIALVLLRVAGAVTVPTPLLPGSSGW